MMVANLCFTHKVIGGTKDKYGCFEVYSKNLIIVLRLSEGV